MPYLTPDETSDTYAPFIVYMPVDETGIPIFGALAIFKGALLELTESSNYEQFGTLTPDEIAAIFQTVWDLTFPLQEC
jgi:hypothetical protein